MSKHLTTKHTTRLFQLLSKTRRRTTALVKFCRHAGQILRERIPLVSHVRDLRHERGLVSDTAIPRRSLGYRGRCILAITEMIIVVIVLLHGYELFQEAEHIVGDIIFRHQIPHGISSSLLVIVLGIIISTVTYYAMIKPGDLRQAMKEHAEDWDE